MISYSLICSKEHQFEAWFRSYDDYNNQVISKMIDCPICGDNNVQKGLMAPAVQSSKNKIRNQEAKNSIKNNSTENLDHNVVANSDHLRVAFNMLRKYVEKNCENVGDNFAQEARKISKGEAIERNIYGKATFEEVEKLQEDGIDIASIPWVKEDS
tara:strand:+ start:13 stop:480 length:468 start_codon:yes stop_codon:yes gene_type:complete